MIKDELVVTPVECYECKIRLTKTFMYCVSLCSSIQDDGNIYTLRFNKSRRNVSVYFCEQCWTNLAGNNYKFEEKQKTDYYLGESGGTTYVGQTSSNAGVQGAWHHQNYMPPAPLKNTLFPNNKPGYNIPVILTRDGLIKTPIEEEIEKFYNKREFDGTDALVLLVVAAILTGIGYGLWRLGSFLLA